MSLFCSMVACNRLWLYGKSIARGKEGKQMEIIQSTSCRSPNGLSSRALDYLIAKIDLFSKENKSYKNTSLLLYKHYTHAQSLWQFANIPIYTCVG